MGWTNHDLTVTTWASFCSFPACSILPQVFLWPHLTLLPCTFYAQQMPFTILHGYPVPRFSNDFHDAPYLIALNEWVGKFMFWSFRVLAGQLSYKTSGVRIYCWLQSNQLPFGFLKPIIPHYCLWNFPVDSTYYWDGSGPKNSCLEMKNRKKKMRESSWNSDKALVVCCLEVSCWVLCPDANLIHILGETCLFFLFI